MDSAFFGLVLGNLFFLLVGLIHITHTIINRIYGYMKYKQCGGCLSDATIAEIRENSAGRALLLFSWIALAIELTLSQITSPYEKENWTSFWQLYNWSSDSGYAIVAWLAFVLLMLVVIGFAYVHYSLGINWSGNVVVKKDHELVTSGPYSFARHPMYAVLLPAPLFYLIMTGSWLISVTFALCLVYPVSRARAEERVMQNLFGEEYRSYMDRVGPFFPCPIDESLWRNKIIGDQDPLPLLESDEDLIPMMSDPHRLEIGYSSDESQALGSDSQQQQQQQQTFQTQQSHDLLDLLDSSNSSSADETPTDLESIDLQQFQ